MAAHQCLCGLACLGTDTNRLYRKVVVGRRACKKAPAGTILELHERELIDNSYCKGTLNTARCSKTPPVILSSDGILDTLLCYCYFRVVTHPNENVRCLPPGSDGEHFSFLYGQQKIPLRGFFVVCNIFAPLILFCLFGNRKAKHFCFALCTAT